jgi:hypothetical protein
MIATAVPCDEKCEEPTGSLEPRIAARFSNQRTLVDLRGPLRSDPLFARPGALFANYHRFGFSDVILRRQADALLFVPETKPVS